VIEVRKTSTQKGNDALFTGREKALAYIYPITDIYI
jgi:hypothetical protein